MISKVTLRDIAAAAGVHYSTVSLALRNHPRISAPIRKHINEIAAKMGYVPDPALCALNAYRKTKLKAHYQSTIAWVDCWKGPIKLRGQPTFNEYFEGAAARAHELGYELEDFRLEQHGVTPEQASKILQNRGIKGLLLAPLPDPGTLPLNYDYFSSITFGYSLRPHTFHLVTNHQTHSITLALQHLKALGYKRIGLFVHEAIDEKVDNAYTMGFWHFFKKRPKETYLKPYVLKPGEPDGDACKKWYLKHKPDVIVSIGGLGVVDWMHELGLEVPRDVGYVRLSVGKDDQHFSGIYENGFLIGRTAVDFLVGLLQRGECGVPETPIRMLVEGVWHPGETVRPQ